MSEYGSPPPPPGAPPPGIQPPYGSPPDNYLVWAILSTVFCCLPLGVASIVFAAQVNGKWAAGDYAGAQDSSTKAKQFAIWSAVVSVVLLVLGVVLAVLLAAFGTAASST